MGWIKLCMLLTLIDLILAVMVMLRMEMGFKLCLVEMFKKLRKFKLIPKIPKLQKKKICNFWNLDLKKNKLNCTKVTVN